MFNRSRGKIVCFLMIVQLSIVYLQCVSANKSIRDRLAAWTEREKAFLTYINTNPLMCNQPNKYIVLDCLVQSLHSLSFILLVAIFSGPGQFTITSVSIGADRNLINVTYMEVSHVTIYSYWLCMTL